MRLLHAMSPYSIIHLLMLALDRITIGDQQQLKGFLTQQFSPTRPEKCGFFCSVVTNAQLYRKFIYYYSMRGKFFFFVCVAADSIVACDGLAEERKKTHQHSNIHKGGKGIWEIGQKVRLEVMRRALCWEKKKTDKKRRKTKDDVENSNGTSPWQSRPCLAIPGSSFGRSIFSPSCSLGFLLFLRMLSVFSSSPPFSHQRWVC